ncbi:site-specific integrase [Photobacterium kishitanii]|uniref:site-specific integrase n=1 Tax=Photobacterium kishitanii TaxID=318456 RepID=UPI000D16EF0F|nr:site-specific integrase [Photobacterium kishitanii]PSV16535.1 site-specific integrase [Photobacterium kishitanii]
MIDEKTDLPSMFLTIYGFNQLNKKALGTQENIMISIRFFYEYYLKKHTKTFDYDLYQKNYNIDSFILELNSFFYYLLDKQHKNNKSHIEIINPIHLNISKYNKLTYGGHIRSIGRYFKYLNNRYMNVKYQKLSPTDAHNIQKNNEKVLAAEIKSFNSLSVSNNEPANRYKSITKIQYIALNNMLIPSTPEFTDIDTGEVYEEVINTQNPFKRGFEQYRNYLIHRLMYTYGLRVAECLMLTKDSIGPTLPDARGDVHYVLIVQSLPNDIEDPRKRPPSLKTVNSCRHIKLDIDDYSLLTIYVGSYRDPIFKKKEEKDHNILFIKDRGKLTPLTYDAVRSFYKKKIDPSFNTINNYDPSNTKRNIEPIPVLTPHVGRHTWAYMTLEYIYNDLLKEELSLSKNYGITTRMKGLLDAAADQLRVLGGWSEISTMPMLYGKRFIEIVASRSNSNRIKNPINL